MKKPSIAYLQIHSGCSTLSSCDVMLYRIIDTVNLGLETKPADYSQLLVTKGPDWTVGLVVREDHTSHNKLTNSIFFEDMTFWYENNGLRTFEKTDDFKNLVDSYVAKGWKRKLPVFIEKMISVERDAVDYKDLEARIKNCYVFPSWHAKVDYRGSISAAVWHDKGLQSYLKDGGCHGYIGSISRTHKSDIALVTMLNKRKWTPRMIAEFMSSTYGRHFADQLDHKHCSVKYMESFFDKGYNPEKADWFIEATSNQLQDQRRNDEQLMMK